MFLRFCQQAMERVEFIKCASNPDARVLVILQLDTRSTAGLAVARQSGLKLLV